MYSFKSLIWMEAMLASLALASAEPNLEKKSFTHVVKRDSGNMTFEEATVGFVATYAKYGFPLPPDAYKYLYKRNVKRAGTLSGTQAATAEPNDNAYDASVVIGGNQALNLDFDSGSPDLWVFSTNLPAADTAGHNVFDPSKSTTFKVLPGYTWAINYGDATHPAGASGTEVGVDTVTIGGVTVTDQVVELASVVSNNFVANTRNDGLVGLAFSAFNQVSSPTGPAPQKTWFENIISSLKLPVFSVNLKPGSGTYAFGIIDSTQYTGTLTTVPVDPSQGYWQFDSPAYKIGTVQSPNPNGFPAIADTGTTGLLIDPEIVSAYYSQVTGAKQSAEFANQWIFPCDSPLPDFSVAIGPNYFAVMPGSGLIFLREGDTCLGYIQPGGGPLNIYGDSMFKTQYVVFDGENIALSFAPKVIPTTTSTTTTATPTTMTGPVTGPMTTVATGSQSSSSTSAACGTVTHYTTKTMFPSGTSNSGPHPTYYVNGAIGRDIAYSWGLCAVTVASLFFLAF